MSKGNLNERNDVLIVSQTWSPDISYFCASR